VEWTVTRRQPPSLQTLAASSCLRHPAFAVVGFFLLVF
jgi:hypothetical protein